MDVFIVFGPHTSSEIFFFFLFKSEGSEESGLFVEREVKRNEGWAVLRSWSGPSLIVEPDLM